MKSPVDGNTENKISPNLQSVNCEFGLFHCVLDRRTAPLDLIPKWMGNLGALIFKADASMTRKEEGATMNLLDFLHKEFQTTTDSHS